MICADDYLHGREEVYFYLNPASVSIGQGIRAGIRYNSVPITQSSGKYGTGFYSDRGCTLSSCVGWDKARFTLNFSVFIEKFGTTPQNGQASTCRNTGVSMERYYRSQQPPQQNLNYIVTGVNDIRSCLHARPDDHAQCGELPQALAQGADRRSGQHRSLQLEPAQSLRYPYT